MCCALSQIAKHSVDLAEVVVGAEIFPKILTCLKFPDEFVKKHSATVVREVAKHTPELAQLVVGNGGVGALVDYISEFARGAYRRSCGLMEWARGGGREGACSMARGLGRHFGTGCRHGCNTGGLNMRSGSLYGGAADRSLNMLLALSHVPKHGGKIAALPGAHLLLHAAANFPPLLPARPAPHRTTRRLCGQQPAAGHHGAGLHRRVLGDAGTVGHCGEGPAAASVGAQRGAGGPPQKRHRLDAGAGAFWDFDADGHSS